MIGPFGLTGGCHDTRTAVSLTTTMTGTSTPSGAATQHINRLLLSISQLTLTLCYLGVFTVYGPPLVTSALYVSKF